jgi:hypothetical protein
MPEKVYQNYLMDIIKASRKDANYDIPWIVAQASRIGGCSGSSVIESKGILSAQKFVTTDSSGIKQVYEGPNTDLIEVPRNPAPIYTCVHFSPAAFADLATAWTISIDQALKKGMRPMAFNPLPSIAAYCGPENSVVLKKLNAKYVKGNWYNSQGELVGSIFDDLPISPGIYTAVLSDSLGKEFSIPKIQISLLASPNPPSIKALTDTLFCENTTANLQAIEGKVSYVWNTGSLEQSITVNSTGVFKVKTIDDLACMSDYSKPISTQRYPLPPTPGISVMSPYYLTAGQRLADLEYVWYLNGSKMPTRPNSFNLHAKASGVYQAKASTTYPKGLTCLSPFSNEIVYKLPEGNGLVTYPNPVSREVFVQSQFDLIGAKYFIYALDGRQMLQGTINDSIEFKINLSELNPGVYKLVVVSTDLAILQKSIVVESH